MRLGRSEAVAWTGIARAPDIGDAWYGLAIEHVVTRLVRDSAAVLDAIAGNMPGDPYSAPPQRRPFIQETDASPGGFE